MSSSRPSRQFVLNDVYINQVDSWFVEVGIRLLDFHGIFPGKDESEIINHVLTHFLIGANVFCLLFQALPQT